ncbi:MAG: class I SAM-dependent methyltransferase [Anaerolineales bacterium]|jgi:cyclopropane fatty-acyl-phospholipid synthase-like methyltransferase
MSDFLKAWSTKAPLGRALDIGAGVGNQSRWLASRGFKVDAVEIHPDQLKTLQTTVHGSNVTIHATDICQFDLVSRRYSLIAALAVFHFIAPSQMRPLAERLQESLAPGGLLLAQVFTTDDPGFDEAKQNGLKQIEDNTFAVDPPVNLIHYFEKDELRRLFSQLEVLHYKTERVIATTSDADYRAGAAIVARRKPQDHFKPT